MRRQKKRNPKFNEREFLFVFSAEGNPKTDFLPCSPLFSPQTVTDVTGSLVLKKMRGGDCHGRPFRLVHRSCGRPHLAQDGSRCQLLRLALLKEHGQEGPFVRKEIAAEKGPGRGLQ